MNFTVDINQLVEVCGDAIVVTDAAGLITLWNPAAERMFGFSRSEAVGQSLDIIVPERTRQRHWDAWNVTMQTGKTRYGDQLLKVPALTKDGRTLSIAFTIALMRAHDGEINGVASFIRDETVRFAEDRRLRKRIAELEAGAAAPGQDKTN